VEIFRKKPKNKALPFPISLKLKNGIIKGDLQNFRFTFFYVTALFVNRIKKTLLKTKPINFSSLPSFPLAFPPVFPPAPLWFHFSVYFITHFHFGN